MSFDADELKNQAAELEQLLQLLRPHPRATLVSRRSMEYIAALSGNQDLIDFLDEREERTLFWCLDGEYMEQRLRLDEFPAS
jgi:hypothetical protein